MLRGGLRRDASLDLSDLFGAEAEPVQAGEPADTVVLREPRADGSRLVAGEAETTHDLRGVEIPVRGRLKACLRRRGGGHGTTRGRERARQGRRDQREQQRASHCEARIGTDAPWP